MLINDGEEGKLGKEIKHKTDITNQITQREKATKKYSQFHRIKGEKVYVY